MKIFVTGVNGQLGHDVVNELVSRGIEAVGSDITEAYAGLPDGTAVAEAPFVQLDITDSQAAEKVLKELSPDAIIHCAAWTAVDAAEDEENREKVFAVNVEGTRNLAKCAKALDIPMLYISTDYVFSGEGTAPFEADDTDFAPSSVYGKTKLLGEEAVRELLEKYFIVRIAWVFGVNGKNFVRTMLRVGASHPEVRVVNDQIGTPTYTYDLAKLLADMIVTDRYGTYHATNEGGFISWYDFTKEIFRLAGLDTLVTPVTTEEYGLSKAARPKNSRLSKEKLTEAGFTRLPDWKDALYRFMETIGELKCQKK